MKTFIFLLVTAGLLIVSASTSLGQPATHPFEEIVGEQLISSNVFLLWQETLSGTTRPKQKIYSFDGSRPVDERLVGIPGVSDGPAVDGNRQMVVASGQFNVDPYDDVVAAWEGAGQRIELWIPQFDSTDAMWNAASTVTVDQPAAGSAADGTIIVETGDLDGDGLDEIVLAYQDLNDDIQLQVYDTDGTLTPELKASNAEESVPDLSVDATPFALAVADVDNDGLDEIIQIGVDQLSGGTAEWALYWKIYKYDAGALSVLTRASGFGEPSFEHTIVHYAVEAGRYRSDRPEEFFFVWSFDRRAPAPNTVDDTFVYFLYYDAESGEMGRNATGTETRLEYNAVRSAADMDPLALASGDVDGDGLDEVALGMEEGLYVYSSDDFLNITQHHGFVFDQTFGSSYDYVGIGDVNQDGLAEVIAARLSRGSTHESYVIRAMSPYDAVEGWRTSVINLGRAVIQEQIELDERGDRRFAIAIGSFDGFSFTLGEPSHSVASDVSQPLVILNAPPVHFDMFGGEEFDVNKCYDGQDCGFVATYATSTTTEMEVTTEVKKDWGVSAGIGYEGEVSTAPMGVGATVSVEAYLDLKYGENFSLEETEGETVSVSVEIGAADDDVIYATVTDYDVWEYPVYHGTEVEPRRFIVVPEPRYTEGRWFPSKTWSGNAYIPDHEVGNILSYPAYPELGDNPNLAQPIKASYESDTFVLGAQPSYQWTLDFSSFDTETVDTTREAGFDSKLHVGVVRLSGDYTRSDMSTHKTTVREGLNLNVSLGGIDRTFGETEYSVTPYAYWATNDALVVDYAARPERAAGGGSATWWDENYGSEPDPAFILPWRYDPEKGFGISEEAKRHQTKDVIFDNPAPLPGDTLTLTARIRNFSLVGTPSPVTAHFYVGDPDDGGKSIVGMNGETSASTAEAIPAQRWADAVMKWVVPNDLGGYQRIYARLDADDTITEIHTNNNKGFNILNLSGSVAIDDAGDEGILPDEVRLASAYPNPFVTSTAIPYSIGRAGHVTLEVYDALGRRIETIHSGRKSAGVHEARWDGDGRASGVYFVVLQANGARHSRQVLLVR